MRKRLTYVSATPDHGRFVAAFMRAPDRLECLAAAGLHPANAIEVSLRSSSIAVTALWDGEPVGLFGVAPVQMIDGVGMPWLLSTDAADALAREWLVDAPQWLMLISDGYAVLRNWVDARNVRSQRWLRRMGFTLGLPEPHGVQGLAFLPFERRV